MTDNVIEKYIRDLTKIGKIRLGFMPGVYHLRNARKVLTKKNLRTDFVDLENTFEYVRKRFICIVMRVICTPEWILFSVKVISEI